MISCVDVLGPGPLGAPGPRCRIRVEHVTTYCQASYLLSGMHPNVAAYFAPNNRIQTTYCQASYLLSGKLPSIRQATYYQASYLLSGRLSAVMKQATYSQAGFQPL